MNLGVGDLLDKKLLFVTGKGGVGKSTAALALGLAGVKRGKRTIVCEVASQENVSRVFRRAQVGFNEVELSPGLWGISIDPDESMREYLLLQLKVKAMRDLLVRSKLFLYLAQAAPGLKELVTIGKIWELTLAERKVKGTDPYDLVVVDAPATGHGVGFLQTPRTFAEIAKVGPIHSQAATLDALVTDHDQTGAVIVALPEEMPVNETASLEAQLLDDVGVAVDGILMNALYPARFDSDEAKALSGMLEGTEGPARAALLAALSEHRRVDNQQRQLNRLNEMVRTPVKELPFIFKPQLDLGDFNELADLIS